MVGTIDALTPSALAPVVRVKTQSAPDAKQDQTQSPAAVQSADAAQTPPKGPPEQSDIQSKLEAAVNERLARLLGSDVRLSIARDEGTGDFVYRSVDKETGEVRRQYPAEDILRMLAFFRELEGLIFDKKA